MRVYRNEDTLTVRLDDSLVGTLERVEASCLFRGAVIGELFTIDSSNRHKVQEWKKVRLHLNEKLIKQRRTLGW